MVAVRHDCLGEHFSPIAIRSGSLLIDWNTSVRILFAGKRLHLPVEGEVTLRNQLSIREIEIDERLTVRAMGENAWLIEYRSRVSESIDCVAKCLRLLVQPDGERTALYVLRYDASHKFLRSRAAAYALTFTALLLVACAAWLLSQLATAWAL